MQKCSMAADRGRYTFSFEPVYSLAESPSSLLVNCFIQMLHRNQRVQGLAHENETRQDKQFTENIMI